MKKKLQYLFLSLLGLILLKGFFFSGVTQEYTTSRLFKQAVESGYVWASAGAHYKRSAIGEFFLGKHYRNVWAVPVKVPVLNLATLHGGMQIGEMGGGMQTTSLNLKNNLGNTYVLRSLDKDPISVLPAFWQKTIVANLTRDQISAANPYAALVVTRLAKAAGIVHTNPQVVFVPATDTKLSAFAGRMANKLFLLEEKYSSAFPPTLPFGQTVEILNTVEMLDKRFRYNTHCINQLAYAQCRLFDILIGDWDRHEGQWNWAAYESEKTVWYYPIPKDRDQAFSQYHDGVIPWLLTRDFALRKFGNFSEYPEDATAYAINASFLDERALNQVTRTDFKRIAQQLQLKLTDEIIDQAVKSFPPPVYNIIGTETARKLKSRRNYLVQVAEAYYQLLAKKVVIAGSDEPEKFVVNRLNDQQTKVQVYQLTQTGVPGKLLYNRIFNLDDTQEITLHALAGEDAAEINGKVNTGLVVNIVGGLGPDKIIDKSVVKTGQNKTVVYDTRKGNHIVWGPQTQNKTTDNIAVHLYDREGF